MATNNTLSVYDPIFYAQEALEALEKSLGMAARVVRGYDKSPQQKGSLISIRVPSVFTAQPAPAAPQALQASEVQIKLDNWREVKFALTDKELTYTTDQIINEHIRPAAYALADDIDQYLVALYKDIPWVVNVTQPTAGPTVGDITAARKILFDNKNPMNDGNLHLMIDGTLEAAFLSLPAFSQWQGAGQQGVDTQMRGSLGNKFGFEVFANQNVATHTGGVAADAVGALTVKALKGSSTVTFDSVTTAATFSAGDSFTLAGDTQRYVFSEAQLASGGAVTNAKIFPALQQDADIGTIITVDIGGAGKTVQNMAFHRGAFALAMAPLSEMGNNIGAKIATVDDPKTGLTLRSRIFYVGASSEVHVALDVLFGVKTLNPNRAVRMRN